MSYDSENKITAAHVMSVILFSKLINFYRRFDPVIKGFSYFIKNIQISTASNVGC